MKNKRGWIKIIEAFIAILLITSALLIVVQKGYIGGKDISTKVYESQLSVLREIELDDVLREEVLSESISPPEKVTSSNAGGVYEIINKRMPDYLGCEAVICELNVVCALDGAQVEKDIYAQSVAIAATAGRYEPRQLKLFCWRK